MFILFIVFTLAMVAAGVYLMVKEPNLFKFLTKYILGVIALFAIEFAMLYIIPDFHVAAIILQLIMPIQVFIFQVAAIILSILKVLKIGLCTKKTVIKVMAVIAISIAVVMLTRLDYMKKTYRYENTGIDDGITTFYIVKTEYYRDKVVLTWDGELEDLEYCQFEDNLDVTIDGHKIIINSDNPYNITSFSMRLSDYLFEFRYLNTSSYAEILTVYDTAGGEHVTGDINRFYTQEEKAEQRKIARSIRDKKEREQKLFDSFFGTWKSDDGEVVKFFIDENGTRRVTVADIMVDQRYDGMSESSRSGYDYDVYLDAGTCGMTFKFEIAVEENKLTTNMTDDKVFTLNRNEVGE